MHFAGRSSPSSLKSKATNVSRDGPSAVIEHRLLDMRALLTIAATIAVLLVVDAIAFDGRHRQATGREVQTQANLFTYNLNRMMRIAGRN